MAVVSPDGSLTGSIGNKTYRKRLGQNVVSSKPTNNTLVGVKSMDDDQLRELARHTGYSVEELKNIRAKQRSMDDALDYCRGADLSDFEPSKPGETRFNRCVGDYLKGKVS